MTGAAAAGRAENRRLQNPPYQTAGAGGGAPGRGGAGTASAFGYAPHRVRWPRTIESAKKQPTLLPAVHAPLYAGSPSSAERLIFAVDDEHSDRQILERLLQQPGLEYPCRVFSSGDEMIDALLQVLRGHPPPLACFVDVKMAGMSGFDVLRWIRCQDVLDAVPVIMLSSSDDPQKLTEARGVGAQCYVAKFPTAGELRAIITEAQRYAEDHSAPSAFRLTCNLLLNPQGTGRSSSRAPV